MQPALRRNGFFKVTFAPARSAFEYFQAFEVNLGDIPASGAVFIPGVEQGP